MVPHIQTGFHVSRPTHLSSMYAFRDYRAITFSMAVLFPEHSSKHIKTFGLIRFRSPLLTESLRFLFLRYLDVSVLRVCSHCWVTCLQHAGLPHSDICGSIRVCNPRSFSQLTTSFVASESLGIRHTPLTISFPILY